ncbi:hypothetical protein GCM10010441_62320 [Kitasatospora paracochleata]|uniref:ABC-2 family transporter n=1 Tax=Kitasatospora paracochleata TaxID=58354 RepID=A0ABT1IZK2_9ACTN|nr:ABC transporter permease subunit [Kitasatospora paracochleata]MCP2310563.1 hypothetical protein [Kitasatospora paracochleata]
MTTALASEVSTPTGPQPSRQRRILRGAAWLGLRQERTPLLISGAVLVLLCGWMLVLGSRIQDVVESEHIQGCNLVYFPQQCENLTGAAIALNDRWSIAVAATGWLLAVLPVAFGAFFAAPMLAREFETGTYGLAWTQSVSRQRWLAARLGVPLLITLVGSSVLAVVSTWWTGVVEGRFAVPGYYHWFTWMSRAASGPSVVGFFLLSVALGATVGLLVRRVVASILVTAVATLALRFAVDQARYLFAPTREVFTPIAMAGPLPDDMKNAVLTQQLPTNTPFESEPVGHGLLTGDGLRIPLQSNWLNHLTDGTWQCPTPECLSHHDTIVQLYARYRPAGDEWIMHWTQTGLSLAATVMLLGLCAWRVRRIR